MRELSAMSTRMSACRLVKKSVFFYVNTDVCMSVGEQSCCLDGMSQGPILLPAASPTLGGLYEDAVKDVTSPENDEESYYDYWSRWSGQEGNFTPEVAFNTYLFR